MRAQKSVIPVTEKTTEFEGLGCKIGVDFGCFGGGTLTILKKSSFAFDVLWQSGPVNELSIKNLLRGAD